MKGYLSLKREREIFKKLKMMSCNQVNTPMECGVKLSKEDGEIKIDPDHISESYWKPKVLNMY